MTYADCIAEKESVGRSGLLDLGGIFYIEKQRDNWMRLYRYVYEVTEVTLACKPLL